MLFRLYFLFFLFAFVTPQVQLNPGEGSETRSITNSFGEVIECYVERMKDGSFVGGPVRPERCWVFEADVGLGFQPTGYDLVLQEPWSLGNQMQVIIYKGDIPECLRRNSLSSCEISPDYIPAMEAATVNIFAETSLPSQVSWPIDAPLFVVYLRESSASATTATFSFRMTSRVVEPVESLRLALGLIFAIGLPLGCVGCSHLCTYTRVIQTTTEKLERQIPKWPGSLFTLGLFGGLIIVIMFVQNGF